MKSSVRRSPLVVFGLFVVAMTLASASAQGGIVVYSQGFETDTDGWFDSSNGFFGTITRVASGTGGITSADGSFHAVLQQGPTGAPMPQNVTGPATNFGGSSTSWPGGFTASADIFLDTTWDLGEGFDYSVAVNRSVAPVGRDFIFHVTQDTSTMDLLVGASNNSNFRPREDLDSLANHAVIGSSGWYTFEHDFYDLSGVLAVDLNLYDSSGVLLFSHTLSDPTDLIPPVVGGYQYGWATHIHVDGGIAVDNVVLTVVPEPATIALWGLGTVLLAGYRWRRRTPLPR